MNRDNIKAVRDQLLRLRNHHRFNMESWLGFIDGRDWDVRNNWDDRKSPAGRVKNDCGTSACIAGWTTALLAPQTLENDVRQTAADLLGLSRDEADRLFLPFDHLDDSWDGRIEDIPPRAAARVLDHLLETGEVDWSIIGPRECYDENGEKIT